MVDVGKLGAIEKGAIPVATVDAYASRIDVLPADAGDSPAKRLVRLEEAVRREIAGFVEVLPSVRVTDAEVAELRATFGGDGSLGDALDGLLAYKEDLEGFVGFAFLVRALAYDRLAERAALTQADVDEAVLAALEPWAARFGYAGIRKITDREPGYVFTDSIRRGELQYDYFFKGQLFEIVSPPGYNIHGHLAHVLQWLYFSWRHERARPDDEAARRAIAGVYRKVPEVRSCEMFRRLTDTLNSSVQLRLAEGAPPNFKELAVNYRGFPKSVTDPASVTRVLEIVLYSSLDPARPVKLEPTSVMVTRPSEAEVKALYRPETEEEHRQIGSRLPF